MLSSTNQLQRLTPHRAPILAQGLGLHVVLALYIGLHYWRFGCEVRSLIQHYHVAQRPPCVLDAASPDAERPATIIFLHGYNDDAEGLPPAG
jgi:hypothetical protein